MIRTGILKEASRARRELVLPNGTRYWRTNVIVSSADARPGPQAFLVEQDLNTVILTHFHREAEFQVVVAGSGRLGRHEVRPITVHYAGQHTGYGPIEAGPEGLWYYTLRPAMDSGALFLPEERDQMKRIAKRHLLADPAAIASRDQLAARNIAAEETLIAPQDDGVAAWLLRLPAGARRQPPQHTRSGGWFYLVAEGELIAGGRVLGRLDCGFVSADERGFVIEAGGAGLEVLTLQFPDSCFDH
jgi:hypothetical protein